MEKNEQVSSKNNYLIMALITLVFFLVYGVIDQLFFTPRIAYVDSNKLLVGFSEANKVEKELKVENDKWQIQLKQLQDSLEASIATMSKNYDKATAAKKKELQDGLAARNQQINNFQQANLRRMDELRQKKMLGVIEKANLFLSEYGKNQHYSIIFGTASGGSILFGNEQKYDITNRVIKGLNERYK